MRCEHNLYFLRDLFKHISDSQFLEIYTTSKEIMSFHDRGVVVFRFGRSRNDLSRNIALSYHLAKGGLLLFVSDDGLSIIFECINFFHSLFAYYS